MGDIKCTILIVYFYFCIYVNNWIRKQLMEGLKSLNTETFLFGTICKHLIADLKHIYIRIFFYFNTYVNKHLDDVANCLHMDIFQLEPVQTPV